MVFLSGGEPTIDRNFFDFLRHARRIASDEVWICTTGFHLTPSFLAEAKRLGLTGIALSLQHTNIRLDQKLRQNKFAYTRFFDAAKLAKEMGFKVIFEMTLTKLAMDCWKEFIKIGEEHDVDAVMFKRFRPIGRGKEDTEIAVPVKEYRELLEEVVKYSVHEAKLPVKIDDPMYGVVVAEMLERDGSSFSSYHAKFESEFSSIIPVDSPCSPAVDREAFFDELYDSASLKRVWGCKAGIDWIGVDPFGNVSPCPLMLEAGMMIGNLLSGPVVTMLEESNEVKLLSQPSLASSSCEKFSICGGCRAHAGSVSGDFFAKDPMCSRSGSCYGCS